MIVSTGAGTILAACGMLKLVPGHWPPLILPIAAVIALLMHPANLAVIKAQSTPIGLWVVAGSFVLFAIGTLSGADQIEVESIQSSAIVTEPTKTD